MSVIGQETAADLRWETGAVRVLGVDHGTVRCGCAVSDPTGVLVTPLSAVSPEPAQIEALVDEYGIELVVVGLPVGLSGREGEQAEIARAFADELRNLLSIPVEMYDERLTTSLADRSSAGGATADRDSLAAAHLLESWLSANQGGRE